MIIKHLLRLEHKDTNGIYRVIYFAYTGKRFVMLHGFTKKTQKTPSKDLKIAKKRMEELINE